MLKTFFEKLIKTLVLTLFRVKKDQNNMALGAFSLHISKSSRNELTKQVSCGSRGNFWQNKQKTEFWPILALYRVEKHNQNMAPWVYIYIFP